MVAGGGGGASKGVDRESMFGSDLLVATTTMGLHQEDPSGATLFLSFCTMTAQILNSDFGIAHFHL